MPDPKPKTRKRASAGRKAAPEPRSEPLQPPSALHLEGYIVWIYLAGDANGMYERFDIQSAVYRDGSELVLDFDCAHLGNPPHLYRITLRRESALLFRGEWIAGEAEERDSGACSCRVYSNGCRLGLFGVWRRNGEAHHWIAELRPVSTSKVESADEPPADERKPPNGPPDIAETDGLLHHRSTLRDLT